jgi:TetR/AcrR family transcriptional regulator, transcriptional repressor for nem operon
VPPRQNPATRQRLVEAAATLFWERSYGSAGVDDLCRAADARKGSFYHFFPGKADLAMAALEFHWATTRRQVFEPIAETVAPGMERLGALVERTNVIQQRILADKQAVLGCPFASLGQELAHRDPRIREALQTIFDGHCHFLHSWLDEAARGRQISPGDNIARARQIFALFEGALLMAKVGADPAVFVEICAALPALTGRAASPAVRSSAIPELL